MVLIPTLSKIAQQVEHTLSVAVFNLDGLTIEAVDGAGHRTPADPEAYANILEQLMGATDALGIGALEELTVDGDQGTTLVRRLSNRYLVALRVGPEAIVGKARLALRVAAPDLARVL
ncbi:MAG: roadblock/LC7 domain-containing protein [Bradymonadia bacterium]